MLIVADIGNTTVHLGLCDEKGIARVDGVSVDDLARGKGPESILEGVDRGAIRRVVMATVNPPARALFAEMGEELKVSRLADIPAGEDLTNLRLHMHAEREGAVMFADDAYLIELPPD